MQNTKKLYYALKDFSLGLNDKVSPNLLGVNELSVAENAVIGPGYTAKRNGYQLYSSLSSPVKKLFEFNRNDGSTEFLCVTDKFYKYSGAGFQEVTGLLPSSSNVVNLLTTKDRQVKDVALVANGKDLQRYDGTNVAKVTPYTPNQQEQTNPGLNDLSFLNEFRYMAMFKGRLYAAAHPAVKNRVSFCHIDPTLGYAVYDYFPAVNFFDVASDENDEITGIKAFRDALIIFCKRSVWALYGNITADFQLVKINVPTGCVSPGSITMVGNNIFYLSETHVYSLFATDFNTVSAQIISDKVEGTLKGVPVTEKQKASGIFYDNKYYLSFPNGETLVYDALMQAWTKFTNIQANSFLVKDSSLYFGANNGKVYVFHDGYHDDGRAIPFKIATKRIDFEAMPSPKKLRRIWLQTKQFDVSTTGYTLDAQFEHFTKRLVTNTEAQSTSAKWDEAKWDESNWDVSPLVGTQSSKWDEAVWDKSTWDYIEIIQRELKIREKITNVTIILTNDQLFQPFVVYEMQLEYKLKKPKMPHP